MPGANRRYPEARAPDRPPERRYQHRSSSHPPRHGQGQPRRNQMRRLRRLGIVARPRAGARPQDLSGSLHEMRRQRAGSPSPSEYEWGERPFAFDAALRNGGQSETPVKIAAGSQLKTVLGGKKAPRHRSAAKPASARRLSRAPLALYSSLTPLMPREGALPQREADAGFSEAEVVYRKDTYRAIPALHQRSRFRAHSLLEHAISGGCDGAVSQAPYQPRRKGKWPANSDFPSTRMGELPPCGNFADPLSYFSRAGLVLF